MSKNNVIVSKRDGRKVEFDKSKISNAISKANKEVPKELKIDDDTIYGITNEIADSITDTTTVEEIQDMIENKLVNMNKYQLAKTYIIYRHKREMLRKANTTDESILSLIRNENKELAEENSNKNTMLASTQRDYMAGEVSRDLSKRILIPNKITNAHEEGILHFHDLDYFIQPIFNCCLINIKDMFDHGTVMNGKMIETPKGFQVACTVLTQVIAAVASNQYGGQSVDMIHLGKYLRKSKEKYERQMRESGEFDEETIKKVVDMRIKDELKSGVQTIQYQINTLMTTNGQAPFVTLFLHIDDNDPYIEENAAIVEEIIRQRYEGIKNSVGVYVTPAFPKLIYVLDENNCFKGGKYDYITELAIKCTAKRMYPDYISAKKMRENYEGNLFSPMGCVDGKSVIDYKIGENRYVESFERAWYRLSQIFVTKIQPDGKNMYMDTPNVSIWDEKENKYVKQHRIIRNVQSNWRHITFDNGRAIDVTDDHPFEIIDKGVVYARDITEGDSLICNVTHTVPEKIDGSGFDEMMWLKGMLLCDSVYDGNVTLSLGIDEVDLVNKAVDIIERNLGHVTEVIHRERGEKDEYYDVIIRCSSDISKDLFAQFGGKQKIYRTIPQYIFNTSTYEEKLSFMAGMIDADGYINPASNTIQIGSSNRELAMQQLYLAMDLGFPAKMYENHYNSHVIRYIIEFKCTPELTWYMVSNKKIENFSSCMENDSVKHDTCSVSEIFEYAERKYSYDVTTESEHFSVDGIYSHNCRSFLSAWKDETGEYKFEGRFNQGVVSINLPQIGIIADGDEDKFWELLDERLDLCYEALMIRHKALLGTKSDISPIHWQNGAIARLKPGEVIDKYLLNGYSTLSLGYIGLYETTIAMKHCSHTTEVGQEFAMRLMNYLRDTTNRWKKESGLGFALYGTPAESLCYRFASIDKKKFGDIKDITDKGYYTNSYHIDVREKIDVFSKFAFESEFQKISSGGAISYAEIPNIEHNLEALKDVVIFIYNNMQYAEFNTKSDVCHECGFEGEIILNEENEWECPQCGNKNKTRMNVTRRTCGLTNPNSPR